MPAEKKDMPWLQKAAKKIFHILAAGVLCCSMYIGAALADTGEAERNKYAWAQPVRATGLPNFHKVSDELYRGAQPEPAGFAELKKRGIKTVINLRALHSDAAAIAGTGLACEEISFKTWHPEEEDMIEFLKIVTDKARQPVFVHCQHGADRTGTTVALYRMAVQGWHVDEAIREMKEGGFGFHSVWQNLEPFLRGLDIKELRSKAGIVRHESSHNNNHRKADFLRFGLSPQRTVGFRPST